MLQDSYSFSFWNTSIKCCTIKVGDVTRTQITRLNLDKNDLPNVGGSAEAHTLHKKYIFFSSFSKALLSVFNPLVCIW